MAHLCSRVLPPSLVCLQVTSQEAKRGDGSVIVLRSPQHIVSLHGVLQYELL